MTYVIKNYSEEYLEKQFEIGSKILSSWSGATQTSVENLKQAYSRENFDPETKLYAFKDDEMVGFITATIKPLKEGEKILRANMELPIVLEGHKEAEDLLYNRAIEVLRSKGVKRVQSRATGLWGDTEEKVKKYGYEQKKVLNSNASLNTADYNLQAGSLGVRNYDENQDLEPVKRMYIDNKILNEQQLENQLKFLADNPDRVVTWNLCREGDEIKGNSLVTTFGDEGKEGAMGPIQSFGAKRIQIRKEILEKNIEDCRKNGVDKLRLFLFGKFLDKKSEYQEFGFKFGSDLVLYHRDI